MSLLGRLRSAFRNPRQPRVIHVLQRATIRGTYDLAQTTDDNRRHWVSADKYDADSANSKVVRDAMVWRSRYETENNGYAKGVNRTLANYEVGRGPKLRLQTSNRDFNAQVQEAWKKWAKAVKLARKLRTAVKARARDGEAFLLAKVNDGLAHPVSLDLVGIECEQCTSPALQLGCVGRVDGIHFDEFGNPTHYDILPHHPGSTLAPFPSVPDTIPAKFVFHLFQEERPGQHRAIPEASSTVPTCAQSRRWREAVIRSAENLADFSLFLEGDDPPNTDDPYEVAPMSKLEIDKGLMTALPSGKKAFQPKPEQPPATYEMFLRTQVGEQVRPFSMSYSLGACDSKDANFSSAKLDQHPFHFQVDVDQSDIEDLVIDPLFNLWYAEAARVYGWLELFPEATEESPSHTWDWPAMPVINEVDTADSRETNIRTGVLTVPRILAEDGYDSEEELQKAAEYYGITVAQMRAALFDIHFKQPSALRPAKSGDDGDERPATGNNRVRRYSSEKNGNGRSKVPI